ncbi:hypothetical protein E2320_003703 [Naja naja]|nr:hypothetical protein E2320_003703 [Naja naja]
MEFIPWMTASHLLHPINEEEEDGRDESLAQPDTISPSHNSTFPLSLFQSSSHLLHPIREEEEDVLSRILLGAEESLAESFIFYCKDQSDLTITNEGLNENTFNLRTADLNSDRIKCTCRFERAGGWPTSPQSNQMVFRVHDAPPSPGLRVDPLSQRVEEGDPLVFLCSTERGDREKKFHFYKDGLEIISSEEVLLEPSTQPTNPLQNASLRILHASFNHSGEFACSYEEKRSNQWIMSSWSRRTNITVEPVWTQDSNPIWKFSWMVIPLIILLVPFAFYWWRKKNTSPPHEQFQLVEKKEEGDLLGMMESQATTAATSSSAKDSEVTYSCIQDSFTASPPGPTRENHPSQWEEEGIVYSDIVFQPKRRQQKLNFSQVIDYPLFHSMCLWIHYGDSWFRMSISVDLIRYTGRGLGLAKEQISMASWLSHLTPTSPDGYFLLILFFILFEYKRVHENGHPEVPQRKRLWCGEGDRGAKLRLELEGVGVMSLLGMTSCISESLWGEESGGGQDQLPRNPEEKMETIPWMTGLGPPPSSSLPSKSNYSSFLCPRSLYACILLFF